MYTKASFNLINEMEDVSFKSTKIIKSVDILGRDVTEKRTTPLFYIYDDGTVEKKIIIE